MQWEILYEISASLYFVNWQKPRLDTKNIRKQSYSRIKSVLFNVCFASLDQAAVNENPFSKSVNKQLLYT